MRAGVIVPVHGFAPYLPETLDGLLRQSVRPDRIIVVDDGSDPPLVLDPDHLAEGVEVVRREVSGGPAQARADGLAAIEDDVHVVALCDSDDTWLPGTLAAHLAALETPEAAGVGWSFGRATVVGADGLETGERWEEPEPGRHSASELATSLYASNPVPTSSVVLHTEALADVGGFPGPVRVAEDWELWLRLARGGFDALCVPDARIRYRRHPGGLTADVARLARAQIAVHAAHADLVAPEIVEQVRAADLAALAAGLAREGDAEGARSTWTQVAEIRPLTRGERMRLAALGVPGLRSWMGRRRVY